MPNHSPPTDINPTCQVKNPLVNPAIATRLELLKICALDFIARSILYAPAQHNIALMVSKLIIKMYPEFINAMLLIDRYLILELGGEWFGMWMSHSWNGMDSSFKIFITIIAILVYISIKDDELE